METHAQILATPSAIGLLVSFTVPTHLLMDALIMEVPVRLGPLLIALQYVRLHARMEKFYAQEEWTDMVVAQCKIIVIHQ